MGKGKLSKFAEMEAFGHVVQATYSHLNSSDYYLKGKWATGFFKNNSPIILELGCGKGEYTVELARKFPEKNFIGVDIKGARMWKGASQAQEYGLKNLAFLRTNIEVIDLFFGEDEVAEIWLTFPDPQMKKTKKRLTATNFIEKYRKFLSAKGVIHLKTDSNFLFKYTSLMVAENKFNVLAKTDNLYESDLLNDILGIQTFYEKQWLSRGITIKYIAFSPNKNEHLSEPDVEIEKDLYRSFGRNARELP
ncbi:tRNA (guanine(46)-N(7))-methyltransferase [hydrothermal vent metagenome]|uniref:tRNA (guanine(46)-N(7))-methyltransferase n=1 Tax=hydrothermal vent metagenome TaxID=652676 RepID=A0A3B0U1V8_9ZZZZ